MNKRTLIIVGALVVAAGLGWMFKRHVDRSAVLALVKDTGTRLKEALAVPTAAGPDAVQKLDGHAAAAEKNRAALKRLDAAGRQALMDAADDYLLTGQEILRRQAAAHRNRLLLTESLRALRAHFRADRGAGSWVREAVRLRGQVEKHYGEYSLAAETFDKLLESLPASQAKVAFLDSGMPIAEGNLIEDARKRSQEALKRATSEVEGSRRLDR
jgi:tetratricopeptide (TPR) repeat protein